MGWKREMEEKVKGVIKGPGKNIWSCKERLLSLSLETMQAA